MHLLRDQGSYPCKDAVSRPRILESADQTEDSQLRHEFRPDSGRPGTRLKPREVRTFSREKWAAALQVLALTCAPGVVLAVVGGLPSVLRAASSGSAAESRATPRTGVAIFRGRELDYEVVDGWAIHGGDMVLGTVEEVTAEYERWRAGRTPSRDWPLRRDASTVEDDKLWPNATIPYVIDPGFNERGLADIREAINEWNTKTVITLVERTTEDDFMQFLPEGSRCSTFAGRHGGAQPIWLSSPDGCGLGAAVHEIGHVVGLWHEHQREDRDDYVSIPDARIHGASASQFTASHPRQGPYDYASTMHYDGIETIPPGLSIPSYRLSSGDIDGVARLYGRHTGTTTISTNPPGLAILVDGRPVTTPATFHWNPGSEHVLEAKSPQIVGGTRLLFGRWSDGGAGKHRVAADPEQTWIEATYFTQRALRTCADPAAAGTAIIRPGSTDGYYTVRAPVEIEAVAPSGDSDGFRRWLTNRSLSRRREGRRGWVWAGPSSNPVEGSIAEESSTRSEYLASFTKSPLFRVTSNVDDIAISVNDETQRLPWAFPAREHPDGITVEIPGETIESGNDARFRFNSWSDGGARAHRVEVPAAGGSVSVDFTPEFFLRTGVRNRRDMETAISVSPPSDDGFYAAGTQVQVTAVPPPEEHFAGWTGEVSGRDPVQAVVMNAAKSLEAVFTKSEPLRPGEEKELVLSASSRFRLYRSSTGWNVLVPADASELTVRFQSSTAAEVDLYVRRGREVGLDPGGAGHERRIRTDFMSTAPGASETVTITRRSIPRLTNDVFFIALGVPARSTPIRGTLSVAIRRSGIVRALPRAFTFVAATGAEAAPQTVRLTHETAVPVRYRIESSHSWLSASPNEWVQAGDGPAEVAIGANGAGLLPGTHSGALTVVRIESTGASTGGTPTGVEIPVAFVRLPDSGGAIRTVNGARIVSRPQNGDTYGTGETVDVRVDLVAPAHITGKPTLALRIGNRIQPVEWDSKKTSSLCESGSLSLGFRYVVQEEDHDADGISVGENALALNGGRIQTIQGNPAILPLAPIDNHPEHKVDGGNVTAPEVSGVRIRSRPRDGVSYGEGEWIEVQVSFSRGVEVTGSPTLALGIGAGTRQAPMASKSDRVVVFRYAVQSKDSDLDGISVTAGALALSGGTIRDATGVDAALDLGNHAFANDPDHTVDGSKVVAPDVSNVGITSRPQDGISYAAGEEIEVRVGFSSEVEVTGSPTLAFGLGAGTRLVPLAQHAESALYFRYTVQAGDSDTDGISIPEGALALNGGSIRDAAGVDAALDLSGHAVANDPGHKVDGSKAVVPGVIEIRVSSRPQDGVSYGAGESISAYVRFSHDIAVTGSPTLALSVGTETRAAALSSQSARYLWFRYTVQAGDTDADGISILAGALELNGGNIRSTAGGDASLEFGSHGISNDPEQRVDGSKVAAPEVNGVGITSSPQDGVAYGAGERISAYVRFSQRVDVTGSPTLALSVGAATRLAANYSNLGQFAWFRYTVQAGDSDTDGISILAGALALNGGSIRSTAGGDAGLDLGSHAIANDSEHSVDGSKVAAPAVNAVRITSRPQDGVAYGAGEQISAYVRFSQSVELTGSPTLALSVGTATKLAAKFSDRDEYVWFRYTVQAGDTDADGISILAGALALNGGSIRSAAGGDAALDLGSRAIINDPGQKVDGSKAPIPAVRRLSVTSRPSNGTSYQAGEVIRGTVYFNVAVEVSGSPTIALTIGSVTRNTPLSSASTTSLFFRYAVQAEDSDPDGISILAGAVALNGGSIRSVAGPDAALDLGSHAIANDPAHKVGGG